MRRGWPLHPIASLGTVTTGSTPQTSQEHFYGGEIPFVTPAELDQIDPVTTAARTLSNSGCLEARLLPEGTVMVCCIGSLGKVGIAGRTVATNQQINSVVFDPTRVCPRFGFYACRRLKLKLKTMAPATTVAIVSKSKFEQLEIPVPPLEEQRWIVKVLDRADALRANRRAALTQLDILTKSIFHDMFGDPAMNAKGWLCKLLCDLITVGPQNGLYKPAGDYGSGTPILRIDAFYDGVVTKLASLKRVRLSDQELALYALREGEIVINRVNSREYLGKSALIPALSETTVFESNMMRFDVDRATLDPTYLIQYLQTSYVRGHILRSAKDAVNQSSINQQDVKALPVVVPPLRMQQLFSQRAAATERLKTTHDASRAEMEALFASLQHQAFREGL